MIIGYGSIRTNLNVFGANQYKLPEQASQLTFYFTLQYLALKSGSVLGRLTLPMLRKEVQCFGSDGCYPLAFGAAGTAIFIGAIFFAIGSSSYVKKPPSGNMLVKVFGCIKVG